MMYYSILASFCLLGMAGSQTINNLTACVTKEQDLQMECKFTSEKRTNLTCTYEVDKKVVASTNANKAVDPTYKGRGTAKITNDVCVLTLTGFSGDKSTMYNCIIQQEKTVSKELSVEKKNMLTCSAGALKHGDVFLLLAFVLPLLSGML